MNKVLIYSPGVFQKFGHSFDYCSGLVKAFNNSGIRCDVIGIQGPLDLNIDKGVNIKRNYEVNNSKGNNPLYQIIWGIKRIIIQKKLINDALKQHIVEKYDLILFETFEYNVLYTKLNEFDTKTAVVFHDTNFSNNKASIIGKFYKQFIRKRVKYIFSKTNASFFHGSKMLIRFKNDLNIKDSIITKATVIPYGADTDFENRVLEKNKACVKLCVEANYSYLLHFGTLRQDKNFDLIFKSLTKISDRWKLIFAGPESDMKYITINSLAIKYDVENKIIIHNEFINSAMQKYYFGAADLILNIYKKDISHESGTAKLSRSFLKPIITSGTQDLSEYIHENKVGWYVKDENELFEAIKKFESQSDEENLLLIENIKKCAFNNSWDVVVQKMINAIK